MANSLEELADPTNRENLLRAEEAAWLHDFWKCTDEHVEYEASDHSENQDAEAYRTKYLHLLGESQITLLGEGPISLQTFIKDYILRTLDRNYIGQASQLWLSDILRKCHRVAHTEKEPVYRPKKQTETHALLGNVFGYESENLTGLTDLLHDCLKPLSPGNTFEHLELKKELEKAFSYVSADTQRPINEVTLWDWSVVIGAFYKALIAAALLLGNKADPSKKVYWQLLSIRFDGFAFVEQAVRISDLLTRQKLINDGLDKVRELLEVTYPLGTEIYRDINGSTFIVPSLSESGSLEVLLGLGDRAGKTLRMHIESAFSRGTIGEKDYLKLGKEVVPFITDKTKRWTRTNAPTHQEPLPIVEHLNKIRQAHPDPEAVRNWWQNHREDVCTVCQVRPQGWGIDNETHYGNRARGEKCSSNCQTCKALARRVCTVCEQRREDRSKRWATEEPHKTIWIDEVSDKYGRIALVVGKFDLEYWLDGKMLFYPTSGEDTLDTQSMNQRSLRLPATVNTDTPARLYRVWETTRSFWKGIEKNFENTVDKVNVRLRIRGAFDPEKSANEDLGNFHAYELKLGNVNLSVVYVGSNEFITADNLERVALLLNSTEKLSGEYEDMARRVFDRLVEENNIEKKGLQIEAPTGYGNPAKVLGRLRLPHDLKYEQALDQTAYVSAVPILADPQTFMAIVPASKAMDVVRSIKVDTTEGSKKKQPGIKEQYEEQMGKVRNRLPITVGIIFAGRRTPLPAILVAGRRILEQPVSDEDWGEDWEVVSIYPSFPRDAWPSQVKLTLKKANDSGTVTKEPDAKGGDTSDLLMQGQQSLTITVPTVMGDKTTPDEWFPYWRMKSPIPDRWVHVCDLHAGDIIHFYPSRFDFQFLETAAQRFEISYEGEKRRGSKHPCRPYFLEELEEIDALWKTLENEGGLTTTQIHNLIELIEGTRLEWQGHWDQKAFEQFVRDALNEAGWKKEKHPARDSDLFKKLHRAAVSGQLADVVELYMRILKKKPERDQEEVTE